MPSNSKAKASNGIKPKATPTRKAAAKPKPGAKKAKLESDVSESDDPTSDDDESDAYEEGEGEEEEEASASVSELDSDDLDASEEEEEEEVTPKGKKRKSNGASGSGSGKKGSAGKKDDGGKNTREVKQAEKVARPKENAETKIILPSTMDFLRQLKVHNDREWFWAHEALYRHAQDNWKTFVTALVPITSEADWTVPHLPAKDLLHRLFRDVRFSSDKTPYKTNLAASLSRTGRKGPFCLYYVHIQPEGRSILAAGKWQPQAAELGAIRRGILADPKPLRKILKDKEFVKYFGEPKHPKEKGRTSSVFGHDDELKNCPKMPGVTKDHPDIDLLKLRSVAVSTRFTDEEVLSDDFLKILGKAMEVVAPFVQCINEMIMPSPPDDDDDGDDPGGDEEEEEEESEEE